MGFKLFKSALYTIVIAAVVLNVGAAVGLNVVVFPYLMQKVFFDKAVVVDDNAKVYVTLECLDDWASSHSTLRARQTKMSEAYRLQYEAYPCDTRAYWKEIFASSRENQGR